MIALQSMLSLPMLMTSVPEEAAMASMTIRNIDDTLKSRLRIRAAEHGRSMEEEARQILRSALANAGPDGESLVASIRRKVEGVGGAELELPPRAFVGEPIDFSE